MNVQLISHTPDALDLLVLSKQTRLDFSAPATLADVKAWPLERKLAELNYMLGTIESSWEFADYVFLITGVSRAFTHQFVRTREGSYAQQSQRTVDMSGFDYVVTGALTRDGAGAEVWSQRAVQADPYWSDPSKNGAWVYHGAMEQINDSYQSLLHLDIPPQDARGLLPTNVATSIVAKFNLRTLSHMAALRLCTRTQGEYQDVFRRMRAAVTDVHPWAEPFLRVHCARHGVCAFPHYKECPIKGPVFNPDTGHRWDGKTEEETGIGMFPVSPATRAEIQQSWEAIRYEAVPHRRALPVVAEQPATREPG